MFTAFVVAFLMVTSPIWLVHTIIEEPWLLIFPVTIVVVSKLYDKLMEKLGLIPPEK